MAAFTQTSSLISKGLGPEQEPAPARAADVDLWIFRDGRRSVSGPEILRHLKSQLRRGQEALVDSLIEAGELECGLADLNDPNAGLTAQLTDELAWQLVGGQASNDLASLAERIAPAETISIAPPEGFTYYALHPLDFARVVTGIGSDPAACAVIGIRSIGTTLSAVAAAALRKMGRPAERITVRPKGHPYDRALTLTPSQLQWVRQQLTRPVRFLIVDEGPGRSGSTFLSVAEELVRDGVPPNSIAILGSRAFDPESLCAHNAAARWRHFRFIATRPSVNLRFADCAYIGGGEWRNTFFNSPEEWCACWTQMERLKFLSADRHTFFKFEGMGPIGAQVRGRAFVLADAGFSPAVQDAKDGFLSYPMVSGRPMRTSDLSESLLDHCAKYCAFRVREFSGQSGNPTELMQMLEHNLRQEFGLELSFEAGDLEPAQCVIADGCMQPYEWITTTEDRFLKTDGISHGDNHFFPGPCDISWDLAGTAVEWELDGEALDFLLTRFHRYSGINARARIGAHMLAYSVYRLGFCKMAASTVRGSPEETRLVCAYVRYRTAVEKVLQSGRKGTRLQDFLDCSRKSSTRTLLSPSRSGACG